MMMVCLLCGVIRTLVKVLMYTECVIIDLLQQIHQPQMAGHICAIFNG